MRAKWFVVGVVMAAAAVAGMSLDAGRARAGSEDDELRFAKAKIYIEYNDTDEDVGVQVMLDGVPWRKLCILRPDEKRILNLTCERGLRRQGLSEFFFESSEPSLADVSLEEFLSRFPAGLYEFEGITIDGEEIEGEATLSHLIPEGPEITSPSADGDEPPVVDPENFVVEWEPVTETINGDPADLEIVRYQIIVDDGESGRRFDITMPADATEVTVPPEFLSDTGLHKVEILAVDASGNQTITEMEFVTEE